MATIKQTAKQVDVFFNNSITKEEFALYMRKFLHTVVIMQLQEEDTTNNATIESGYYWLTQFVEQIDPLLEKQA